MVKLSLLIAAIMLASPAFAQSQAKLSVLGPVIATDAARVTSELDMLLKAAQDAEAKASYWEDACRSTPGCGSPSQSGAQ